MFPSTSVSSTPVTVTVCGVFPVCRLNVQTSRGNRPLGGVAAAQGNRDVERLGRLFSLTVKVAVPPASVVCSPLVGVTVMPAVTVSLSLFVTLTLAAFTPL